MVDYESAIKRPFSDLTKLVIGIVVSIIPVVNFCATGFMLECTGFGKFKDSKKMPEWKDWLGMFVLGLKSVIIGFVYALPATVVFVVVALAFLAMLVSPLGSTMSSEMISSLMSGQVSPLLGLRMFSQGWSFGLSALGALAPLIIIGAVLALISSYLVPVAVINFLKNKKLSAAFELSKIIKKALTGQYFIVWLINIVLSVFAGFVLGFIPVLGPAAALFIVGVITYTTFGQVLRELKI